MIRVALAQILYKPAIMERSVDFLAEPAVNSKASVAALSDTLQQDKAEELQLLRNRIRDEYIVYIRQKLRQILIQADQLYKPDIIVFPEYSVPYQCLPYIKDLSNKLGATIIAGSHTVLESAGEYYKQAGLPIDLSTNLKGYSICPVFLSDGTTGYQIKNHRSNFEMSMSSTAEPEIKRFVTKGSDGSEICFSILICADAISPDVIGQLCVNGGDNHLVFITACSPRSDTFIATSQLLTTNGIPTFLCNHSHYGETGVYLPDEIRNRFANAPGESSYLDKGEEKLMIIELEQEHFYVKRAILDSIVIGSFCQCPILYGDDEIWRKEHRDILFEIDTCLKSKDIDGALEWAEFFTETYTDHLPLPCLTAFQRFKRQLTEGHFGIKYLSASLNIIILKLHSTEAHFYNEIQNIIEFITAKLDDIPIDLLAELGNQRKLYPKEPLISITPVMPASVMRQEPSDEQVGTFRDRGRFMTELEQAISNKAVKLILLSGAYGVGKTSAVEVTFKKNLIDWEKSIITLQGVRFSTALEYMAELIGSPLRADTLTRQTKKILRSIITNFTKQLLAKKGRALVVDQMETVLLDMQHKDLTLLKIFCEAVCSLSEGEGKLIFISDVPFPEAIFPDDPSIHRIVLGRIADQQYVTRILNYEMRRREMVIKGNEPDIPEYIYELVNGHPLTAKLCIDVASRHGMQTLREIPRNQLQRNIVDQLMKRIDLSSVQTQVMCILSVFRTAVDTEILLKHLSNDHRALLIKSRPEFNKLPFMSVWADKIELTSVFRSYYYDQIPEQMFDTYHEYALHYYNELYQKLKEERKFSAVIYTEIAYHLTNLHRLDELAKYLPGNINTLKRMAKDVYQKKNYQDAMNLYQVLDTAYPDDPEILSYLGRCYARDDRWDAADTHFEKAITAAMKKGEETWYLYRDWGHMNIHAHMDIEAEVHFKKARTLLKRELDREDDAGILAAEGYALERSGDDLGAQDKYERALSYNYSHEFTISHYAQLLRKRGLYDDAASLERRINRDSFDSIESENASYFLEFEFSSFGEDKYDE